jgi:hypothetical protein
MRRLLVIYSDLYGGLLKWGTLKSSIVIGCSIINHPYFWGSPILGNFHIPQLLDQILLFVSLSCLSMRLSSTTETLTAEVCLHPIVLLLGIKRHEHTFTHTTLDHTQPRAHSNTLTPTLSSLSLSLSLTCQLPRQHVISSLFASLMCTSTPLRGRQLWASPDPNPSRLNAI